MEHQFACGRSVVAQLKACAKLKDAEAGEKIHACCNDKGLLSRNAFVCNALIRMFAKCGLLEKAQAFFEACIIRDVVSWNSLIAGYVQNLRSNEALDCFQQMRLHGIPCDAVTYCCVLKACGNLRDLHTGRRVHADLEKEGWLRSNTRIGNALLDMYTKCGAISKAQEVFDTLQLRNVVSWTLLIAGYTERGRAHEALDLFEQMQLFGITPDAVTIVCSLKACGSIVAKEKGRELHAYAANNGFLHGNIYVGSALVDMYVKCDMLPKAHEVFDELPDRNIVSWNSLIAGYAHQNLGEEALKCLERMKLESMSPDAATHTCILKACGGIGAAHKGREIHAAMEQEGLLETSQRAGNALVDMYAKSGWLAAAHRVFDKLPVQNTVSWNALITGYGQLGKCQDVLRMFTRMSIEGITASSITFLGVLSACSHAGLLDKGQTYFQAMSEDFGIVPSKEHYACMVDLFGRAGQLERALAAVMRNALVYNSLIMWLSLLGACRKWGNVELGALAFKQAVQLHGKEGALYTCIRNIYADAGLGFMAKKVEAMRVMKQAWN